MALTHSHQNPEPDVYANRPLASQNPDAKGENAEIAHIKNKIFEINLQAFYNTSEEDEEALDAIKPRCYGR